MKTILICVLCLFSMGATYQQTMDAQRAQHDDLMAQARISRAADERMNRRDYWKQTHATVIDTRDSRGNSRTTTIYRN
jgi:hypothetical protein